MPRQVYNFSAGPAMLPPSVLAKAQTELRDYQGSGMSVMEMSHRGKIFGEIISQAEANLRKLMQIPSGYKVLFLQGGAWTQFAMVPLNLFSRSLKADFIDTGAWAAKAIKEANKYGNARVVASSKDKDYTYIPKVKSSDFDPEADYLHITTNNTIYGTLLPSLAEKAGVPLVADMSSNILSQEYRVEDFGLIYAGAQKNIGPSGLTIVIVREDLIGNAMDICPTMLDYQTHADKDSMFNTPPTYAIYLAGLVFEWALAEGGVVAIQKRNEAKAATLYNFLDQSDFYHANVAKPDRSLMNLSFHLENRSLEAELVAATEAAGLLFLKGHRSVGGLRASLYNAMPLAGVEALVAFLTEFERNHS
ncbi:MAG: 3-phosphoserine/phosphohydroxythreonine transaminase [Bacteroidia bacterium]